MKFFRVLILFVFALSFSIFNNSCCNKEYHSEWMYFMSDIIEYSDITMADSVAKEAYGIRIEVFDRKFTNHFNGLFINQSYARTCKTVINEISSINIISVNKLTDDLEEMADVTNYFSGYSETLASHRHATNSPDNNINTLTYLLNKQKSTIVDDIDFNLRNTVIKDTIHQFIIKIEFSDNFILTDTTRSVTIY